MGEARFPVAVVLIALALGALLRVEALTAGFWSDDYLQHAMLAGDYPAQRAAWDLFCFSSGDPADMARLTDYGYYPWWSHHSFKLCMLRPLASLLHALDYHVLGLAPLSHHIHSLLWWAATVVMASLVLVRLLPRPVGAIAVLLFALDESHTIPLLWIANRSALLATTFGLACLWAHIRYRRDAVPPARPLSIGLSALACASGEYAFASLGYLLAFEAIGTRDPFWARLRALAPVVAPFGLYLACWAALGYGSAHSGLYTGPTSAPLSYLGKLVVGLPVLAGDLLLTVPADAWSFGSSWADTLAGLGPGAPDWKTFQLVLGGLSIVLVVALLRGLRGQVADTHLTALRILCLGALLGLPPTLGSFVSTRLLLPASLAAAALAASLLHLCWRWLGRARAEHRARLALGAALGLLSVAYLHGPRAAGSSVEAVHFFAHAARSRTAWPLAAELDDAQLPGQLVVMLAAADANDAAYLPFVLASHGRPMPRAFRLVSPAAGSHDLIRIDPSTVELRVTQPSTLAGSAAGSLTRPDGAPIASGRAFLLPGMRLTVLASEAGQPTRMRVGFDVPLSDPSLLLLQSTERGLVRLRPPPVGERLALPPPQMPDAALLP